MRTSQHSFGVVLLTVYKRILSPLLHAVTGSMGACRFQPTCSEYAIIAFSTRGVVRGSVLTLTRLLRCNPLFAGGFDPVLGIKSAPGRPEVRHGGPAEWSVSAQGCTSEKHAFMHTSTPPVTIE